MSHWKRRIRASGTVGTLTPSLSWKGVYNKLSSLFLGTFMHSSWEGFEFTIQKWWKLKKILNCAIKHEGRITYWVKILLLGSPSWVQWRESLLQIPPRLLLHLVSASGFSGNKQLRGASGVVERPLGTGECVCGCGESQVYVALSCSSTTHAFGI